MVGWGGGRVLEVVGMVVMIAPVGMVVMIASVMMVQVMITQTVTTQW